MKAIITGSSGFVGGYLYNYLKRMGIEVFTIGKSNRASNHLQLSEVDDFKTIHSFIKSISPDFFFHLAGVVEFKNESYARKVNVEYCKVILEALQQSSLLKKTKFVAFGSAAEYGVVKEEELPLNEVYPENPSDLYGRSKLEQTRLIQSFNSELQYLIFRPFTLIGKGMPIHLAIGSFASQINQILADDSLPKIIKTGFLATQRDFLGVGKAVCWIWEACQVSKAYSNIYNLCSGQPTKIQDILDFLISVSGKEISLNQCVKDMRKVNMPIHFGDNTKLLSLLKHDMNLTYSDWKDEARNMIELI